MIGNVWEWTSTLYKYDHVERGFAWNSGAPDDFDTIQVTGRFFGAQSMSNKALGFRCANPDLGAEEPAGLFETLTGTPTPAP